MNLRTFAIGAALVLIAGTSEAAFYQEKNLPNSSSGPLGICVGPDGRAWFTQYAGNRIGAHDLVTNTIQQWSLPTAGSQPMEIVAGPDGALWFTEYGSGRIGRITTAGQISEFPLPGAGAGPAGIAVGPDGNIWATEYVAGNVVRLDPATGAVDEFPVGLGPSGVTSGPDGNLWVTLYDGNAIVRVTTTGGITTFPLPAAASYPNAICAGADGALWFAQTTRNMLGRITTSGTITEYALPTPSAGLHGIAAGSDGSIWFTESLLSRVGRRLPTGEIAEHPTSQPYSVSRGIALSGSGVVHVAQQQKNAIGTLDFRDPLTLFNVSGSTSPVGGGAVTGSDGNLWFGISTSEVGRISPAGSVRRFPLPPEVQSNGIRCFRVGPDGNVWFNYGYGTATGGLAEIDENGTVTPHPLPETPRSFTVTSDGQVWFTMPDSGFGLGRLDPFVGSVAYPALVGDGSNALTSMPGGEIWFIAGEFSVGRMSTSGQVTYAALPAVDFGAAHSIGSGPDGNAWYAKLGGTSIGRVTPTFLVAEIETGRYGDGIAIVPGSDGNLWTTWQTGLVRVTPGLVVTSFNFPLYTRWSPELTGLTPGPDEAVWFTELNNGIIGRFKTRTEAPTSFHTLAPCRILDTRDPVGPLGGPAVAAHSTRVITVTNTCGIPSDAVAISANVTVVPGSGGGFLRVYPGDGGPTITTTVAFAPGVVRASNTMVRLAGDGAGKLGILNDSDDAVHVIVDVNGVFR